MPYVLIVEHDAQVRRMLVVLLRSHHYQTDTATNSEDALARMRDRRPCLVLLDLNLPVMDSWQFRETQLRGDGIADVPVVGMTEMLYPEDVEEKLGIPCVGKPFNFPAIMRHVERFCGAAQGERRLIRAAHTTLWQSRNVPKSAR